MGAFVHLEGSMDVHMLGLTGNLIFKLSFLLIQSVWIPLQLGLPDAQEGCK